LLEVIVISWSDPWRRVKQLPASIQLDHPKSCVHLPPHCLWALWPDEIVHSQRAASAWWLHPSVLGGMVQVGAVVQSKRQYVGKSDGGLFRATDPCALEW